MYWIFRFCKLNEKVQQQFVDNLFYICETLSWYFFNLKCWLSITHCSLSRKATDRTGQLQPRWTTTVNDKDTRAAQFIWDQFQWLCQWKGSWCVKVDLHESGFFVWFCPLPENLNLLRHAPFLVVWSCSLVSLPVSNAVRSKVTISISQRWSVSKKTW